MEMQYRAIPHIVSVVVLVGLFHAGRMVGGTCTFPSDIRGAWVRNHDSQSFTFTDTTVNGFGLKYIANDLPDFYCHTQSGNKYILSSDFLTSSSAPWRYLVCWQLEEVTDSAYILYELTSDDGVTNISPLVPGIAQAQADAVDVSTVCNVSTDYFTALIKDGATSTDVSVQCPSLLFANFEYSECAGSSLTFCPDRVTATADYTTCSTILNSAGGVLSCMGYKEVGSYIYLNLFKHDAGNGVTCVRLEEDSGGVDARYYSGDCSTAGGSSNTLSMTSTLTCPLGGDSSSDDSGVTNIVITVTVIVSVGALALLLYYFKKKKDAGRVGDTGKPLTMVSVNSSNSMTVKPSEAPAATRPGDHVTTPTANGGTPHTTANGTATTPTANGTATTPTADTNPTPPPAAGDANEGEELFPTSARSPHLPPLPNAGVTGQPLRT